MRELRRAGGDAWEKRQRRLHSHLYFVYPMNSHSSEEEKESKETLGNGHDGEEEQDSEVRPTVPIAKTPPIDGNPDVIRSSPSSPFIATLSTAEVKLGGAEERVLNAIPVIQDERKDQRLTEEGITLGTNVEDVHDALLQFSQDLYRTITIIMCVTVSVLYVICFWTMYPLLHILVVFFAIREIRKQLDLDRAKYTNMAERARSNRLLGKDGTKGPERKESVEWMNRLLQRVWPLISRDLFAPAADLLEDVLQSKLPSFVFCFYFVGLDLLY